jgi:cytochrome c-type biogenesis protein CcmF
MIAMLAGALLTLWLAGGPAWALLAVALAAWLLIGTLAEWAQRVKLGRVGLGASLRRARDLPRAAYGMTLAHAGLAVLILGVTGSSAWKQEEIRLMRPGETVTSAGYTYRFEGVESVEGPNYRAERGRFTVERDGRAIAVLQPEKRLYPVQNMPTTEAAIRTNGFADLYAVLGDPDGKGAWAVRLYHEPLVPWIWAGILIMAAGGMVSLSDRRLRVGAPGRRRTEAQAARA